MAVQNTRKKRTKARLGWAGGLAGGMVVALVGVPAAPGQAASDYTVPIPLHPVGADLHLIGASESGVAVQQDETSPGYRPVFTGPLGGELVERPQLGQGITDLQGPTPLAVTGTTLAWYENVFQVGSRPKVGHRLNILTGKDQREAGTQIQPSAFNGDSWFSDIPGSTVNPPSQWQYPLRRHHTGTDTGQGMKTDILVPHVPGVSGGRVMAADRTAVLRVTQSGGNFALDLVTVSTGAATRLAEGPDEIVGVALSEQRAAWAIKASGGGYLIQQKPRAGGNSSGYFESNEHADVAHLTVGLAGIGYLINHPDESDEPSTLVVVNGFQAATKELPYQVSGLAAVGNHFLTASSRTVGDNPSYSTAAGIYRVTTSEFTRVATVPAPSLPAAQLSLSAGRLRYTESKQQQTRTVFERTVTGDRRAQFSTERSVAETSGPMAFSGARGVVKLPGQDGGWQLLDRGQETDRVEAQGDPNISGAYTQIGRKVFRPDGELIYTQPVPAGTTAGADDLFGSSLVYVRTAANGSSRIWLDDAERKTPTVLAEVPAGCDGRTPQVSVWGELVAWSTSCGDQIHWKNTRTGQLRQVGTLATHLERISLSEGTLTWSDLNGPSRVMDLTTGLNAPVALEGRNLLISVDDHRVARVVATPPSWTLAPRAETTPLPFTSKYAPRLISTVSPLGFTPNQNGSADNWKPQFDLTKPMRSVTLKIQDLSGKTVAQIDGTAPDGSVRDLSWNGLSSRGTQLPYGDYRWTLTGRSADGDGTLIGSDGSPTVSGMIELGFY